MIATPSKDPFTPGVGFDVEVFGGTPPFTFTLRPSPPNPPGTTLDGNHCDVPGGAPSGTPVQVDVADSSVPPQQARCTGHVA